MDITFESFLTPPGIIAAGALLTTLIQILKTVIPALDARVSGALMAFIGSAVLYALTAAAVGVATPNAGLTIFAAWLACASAAVGIKATTAHVAEANNGG